MQPYVIGVDIGTGSTKALAVAKNGKVLAAAQAHYGATHSQPGYAEQDPQQILSAFVQCLQAVVTELKAPPALVSFSSCMHSLMAVDATGNPITPLLNWADARSEKVVENLRASPHGEAIYNATGTPLHSMTPFSKIIWFRENNPELFDKVDKWISIKEYIWYRLFGVYEIDYSIAGATGMLNIQTLQWHAPVLELCGITHEKLSQVVNTNYVRRGLMAGMINQLKVPEDLPFCIGSSDGCLSNVGSRALDRGVGALTVGTSGAVRIASAKPVLHFQSMLFNYPLDEHTFICGGPINNGGNMVHWAIKKMQQIEEPSSGEYEAFYNNLKDIPAGSDGLLCLPYFIGERAPVWDAKSSGAFIGVRAYHTPAHFFRAALEGVCFALYDVLQMVEAAAGKVEKLIVSGGFIRSEVWLQMLADITGKELHIMSDRDASATGAALMGMKAIGMIQHYDEVPIVEESSVMPDVTAYQFYASVFSIYKSLYPSLKSSLHQLYYLQQQKG